MRKRHSQSSDAAGLFSRRNGQSNRASCRRTHSAAGYVPTDATQSQFSTSTFANSQAGAPTREQGVALAVAQAPRAPSKKRKVAPVLLLDDESEEGSKRTSTACRQLVSITATAPNGSSVANFSDLTGN